MPTAPPFERTERPIDFAPAPLGPVGTWLAALIRASSELLDAYVIGGRPIREKLHPNVEPELIITCTFRGTTCGELRCWLDRLLAVGVAEGMWNETADSLTADQVSDAARELCGQIIGYAAGEVSAHFPGVLFDPPRLYQMAPGATAGDLGLVALRGGDRAVVPSRLGSLCWEVSEITLGPDGAPPLPQHAITVRDRIRTLRDTDLQLLQAVRVLGVDDGAENAFEQLVRAVGSDPALTARVLRRVNSALQRPRGRRVQTLPQALLYIGTRAAKNIVVSALLSQPLGAPHPARVSVVNHSIQVALLCRHLGTLCRVDPDECYLLGLLHDLGRLVLDRLYPDELGDPVETEEELLKKEVYRLGITHTEAGAIVAMAWRFPDTVRLAMTAHHDGEFIGQLGLPQEQATLIQIVAQADRVIERLDRAEPANAEAACAEADLILKKESGAVHRCLLLVQDQTTEEQHGDTL